jgi:hypothetical protein
VRRIGLSTLTYAMLKCRPLASIPSGAWLPAALARAELARSVHWDASNEALQLIVLHSLGYGDHLTMDSAPPVTGARLGPDDSDVAIAAFHHALHSPECTPHGLAGVRAYVDCIATLGSPSGEQSAALTALKDAPCAH